MAKPFRDGMPKCKFLQPITEEFKCPICLELLSEPHITSCCGSHFCYSCLREVCRREGPICPICRQSFTSQRNPSMSRRINSLRVVCCNKDHGCEWVGEHGQFEGHVKECGYMVARCKLGCGEFVYRRLQEKHYEFICPFRLCDCPYCNKYRGKYRDVEDNHWPQCKWFPVPCPNDCPTGSVPRGRLMDHLKKECRVKQQLTVSREESARLKDKNRQLEQKAKALEVECAQLRQRNLLLERDVGGSKLAHLTIRGHYEGPISVSGGSRAHPSRESRNMKPNLLQNPALVMQWSQCSEVPIPLFEASVVHCGGFVYAGGGICQRVGSFDNECTVFKYDYRNDTWCNLPRTTRHRFTLVALREKLVLVGGKTPKAACLRSLITWDEQEHSWKESLPPMRRARMEAAAVGHGDYIAVAGGSNESGVVSFVEVFCSMRKRWYQARRLPVAISSASSTVLNDHWYLIGGREQKTAVYCVSLSSLIRHAVDEPQSSEAGGNEWESLPNTHSECSTGASFGGCFLAVGGKNSPSVLVYFPGRRTWLPVDHSLPRPFYSSAAVTVSDNELFIIGGCTSVLRYSHVYKATLKNGSS